MESSDTGKIAREPSGMSDGTILFEPNDKTRVLMTTAVWGAWHLMVHLTINLPTLLAEGNLPTLVETCRIRYVIYTRREDFERIDRALVTQALRALHIGIEFRFIASDILKDPIAAHHYAWNAATRDAKDRGEYLLLIPPDVAWAGNSFVAVAERLRRGERAIFMTYLRAESESFVSALHKRAPAGEVVLDISQNDMVDLCMRSLHPLMAASLRDSDFFPIHPEMILWPVPGEGFAVRVLAREMFLFDPGYFNLNHAALPDRPLGGKESSFLCDSDELFAVSLAEIGKDVQWHIHPREASPMTIARWWLTYDSKSNDFMASQKIRWHFAPVTEAKWRAVEAGCDLFIRRLAVVREGLRVWQVAQLRACTKVGPILAFMLNSGALARAAKGREAAIVFLPTDEAFRKPTVNGRAFEPEYDDAAGLIRLARRHHAPITFEQVNPEDPLRHLLQGKSLGRLETAAGPVDIKRDGGAMVVDGRAKVVSKPIKVGSLAVYLLDAIL